MVIQISRNGPIIQIRKNQHKYKQASHSCGAYFFSSASKKINALAKRRLFSSYYTKISQEHNNPCYSPTRFENFGQNYVKINNAYFLHNFRSPHPCLRVCKQRGSVHIFFASTNELLQSPMLGICVKFSWCKRFSGLPTGPSVAMLICCKHF